MNGHKNIENLHSVKWSMNAKGLISGECKCYGNTPEEALQRACKIIADMEIIIQDKNREK